MVKKATATSTHTLIRMALLERGVSMAELARRLGVARSHVTMVAKGQRKNRRIQNALARAAGLRRIELWK